MNIIKLKEEIFQTQWDELERKALEVCRYQYKSLPVYKQFVDLMGVKVDTIQHIHQIPFLPIRFFKSHDIVDTVYSSSQESVTFLSSTTTGQIPSKHTVQDPELYLSSLETGFHHFFGSPNQYCFLGLLPSYLERGNSSLVYMVNHLMQIAKHPSSGFYLHDLEGLFNTIIELEKSKQKTILFGVTYALIDFAEQFEYPLEYTQIIETGGMKGRKIETTRTEVHQLLMNKFSLLDVQSEYGMTELLSQAYSLTNEIFKTPPWMKVLIRDLHDPKDIMESGRGAMNIIDLANIHSCSFIATDDMAELNEDGSFKVLGRLVDAEVRGCSLLSLS